MAWVKAHMRNGKKVAGHNRKTKKGGFGHMGKYSEMEYKHAKSIGIDLRDPDNSRNWDYEGKQSKERLSKKRRK